MGMSDHPSAIETFFRRSFCFSLLVPMRPTRRFDPTLYRRLSASGTRSATKKIPAHGRGQGVPYQK